MHYAPPPLLQPFSNKPGGRQAGRTLEFLIAKIRAKRHANPPQFVALSATLSPMAAKTMSDWLQATLYVAPPTVRPVPLVEHVLTSKGMCVVKVRRFGGGGVLWWDRQSCGDVVAGLTTTIITTTA